MENGNGAVVKSCMHIAELFLLFQEDVSISKGASIRTRALGPLLRFLGV